MSRYTGPSWKLSRRLGMSVSETGKELQKRKYAPGQHGPTRRIKLTEYGTQLQMKQFVRHMYGVNERQFRTTFDKSAKMGGNQGVNFLLLLESRLDSIIYRMGLSNTRRGARQLVNHGHITVDGKRVDIPSYRVQPGQLVSVREKSKNVPVIKAAVESTIGRLPFVTFDDEKLEGSFSRLPERDELPQEIDELLVVEYYKKLI